MYLSMLHVSHLGLIELKLKEHRSSRDTELIPIDSDSNLDFGEIQVYFF